MAVVEVSYKAALLKTHHMGHLLKQSSDCIIRLNILTRSVKNTFQRLIDLPARTVTKAYGGISSSINVISVSV